MNRLKAVFWDVDGTLADTELHGHRLDFNKAFSHFNINWHWDNKTYINLLTIHGGTQRILKYSQLENFEISKQLATEIHFKKQQKYS